MIDKLFPHTYSAVLATLRKRLAEAPPCKVQLLAGPRQVGKTHLLQELAEKWPGRAVYAAADQPAAALSGWWEAQWAEAERLAGDRGRALLLLDEIHHLPDWSPRLKAEHDRIVRQKRPVHVVATGSSSLRLGHGARESMAGRFEKLQLLHWPPSELVRLLGLSPAEAVRAAIAFGTYPGALAFRKDPERLRAYLRDAIVEPALGRDLIALEAIRKPALLRQVFAVATGHPAEIVSLQKLRGELADAGALETIAHYLEILESAYLIAGVEKFSPRAVRRRAAPPKLVVLNQGLVVGAGGSEWAPAGGGSERAGREIENACIAFAWNAGQSVTYWREEPLEVDLVTSGSWGKWAIEIKTGRVGTRDLAGLLEFTRRNREYRPLLLHGPDRGAERAAENSGIAARDWQRFLLEGPPP
jgi:hypothetical protein